MFDNIILHFAYYYKKPPQEMMCHWKNTELKVRHVRGENSLFQSDNHQFIKKFVINFSTLKTHFSMFNFFQYVGKIPVVTHLLNKESMSWLETSMFTFIISIFIWCKPDVFFCTNWSYGSFQFPDSLCPVPISRCFPSVLALFCELVVVPRHQFLTLLPFPL